MKNITVGDFVAVGVDRPGQIVNRIYTLQIHGNALDAISNFASHRKTFKAADLLEIGELGDFHPVQPDFPAQTPGAERGRFPVVFNKTNIVNFGIDAHFAQRTQIQFLNVVGRRFQCHLELVVMLQAVGVLAVAAVFGTTTRLHISRIPGLRAYGAQKSGGVKSAGADFEVKGLQNHAALTCPIFLQCENEPLKSAYIGFLAIMVGETCGVLTVRHEDLPLDCGYERERAPDYNGSVASLVLHCRPSFSCRAFSGKLGAILPVMAGINETRVCLNEKLARAESYKISIIVAALDQPCAGDYRRQPLMVD